MTDRVSRRIPHDSLDSTLSLMSDPYRFISKKCRQHGTDLFQTRILAKPAICLTGPDAAQLFYSGEHFQRAGALPPRIQKTLFGVGGMQGMDGDAHHHRKAMFMSLMSPEGLSRLSEIHLDFWRRYAENWKAREKIVLYRELQKMLTETVCAWTGVPLAKSEISRRTGELAAQFHSGQTLGPSHWRARILRRSAEIWMERVIGKIRNGKLKLPETCAAHAVASHRDDNGRLLSPKIAAVELINVLRPVVAVSVFSTFVTHALQKHPECRARIADENYLEMFVQEVRRFYPFFPAVAAMTRHEFEWNDFRFPAQTRTLLDLYGTNHDERAWREPDNFLPERFQDANVTRFNFIPQGGGNTDTGHRCPGETITVNLMKVAANFLTTQISYDVPPKNLEIDFSKLPAMVKSGFIINRVKM